MLEVGRVHDHDAGHRCGGDVHVVQTNTGTRDDLEPFGDSERLFVDVGGGADQNGVDIDQGCQELLAVGAIAPPDLEVRPEGVDGRRRELFGN